MVERRPTPKPPEPMQPVDLTAAVQMAKHCGECEGALMLLMDRWPRMLVRSLEADELIRSVLLTAGLIASNERYPP